MNEYRMTLTALMMTMVFVSLPLALSFSHLAG
jgi:hypothetical protein